jgi:hypothetical protein
MAQIPRMIPFRRQPDCFSPRVARISQLFSHLYPCHPLSFDEKKKGSIEIGKFGDLDVLSDDLLTCDAERIKDIRPLATVVGGKVVHDVSSP